MNNRRRDFLQASSLAALAPFLGPAAVALGQQTKEGKTGTGSFDQNTYDFWSLQVRSPYDQFVNKKTPKGRKTPSPQDAVFVFYSNATGFVPAESIKPADIKGFPDKGDINVKVHVDRFRPSPADSATLGQLETGTLRIDVKQVTPLPGLPEALAWTAMATLVSGKKGAPSVEKLTFDPGTVWGNLQEIPITKGLGFWTWNFFMKRKIGFWGKLLDELFASPGKSEAFLPLLGIPGIAVSGLTYLDKILGAVQAQGDSTWLFQGLDFPVCATQEAYKNAGGDAASKLVLTDGSYVVVRQDDVKKLSGLDIQLGLLVPPKTKPLEVFDAAKSILTDVSYLTVSVSTSTSTSTSKC